MELEPMLDASAAREAALARARQRMLERARSGVGTLGLGHQNVIPQRPALASGNRFGIRSELHCHMQGETIGTRMDAGKAVQVCVSASSFWSFLRVHGSC